VRLSHGKRTRRGVAIGATVGLHCVVVFWRPFVKRFALCYQTVFCLSCPVCDVGVLWPNGWTDHDETWHAGMPRPRPHCVTYGDPAPLPQRDRDPPIFGPCLLWSRSPISASAELLLSIRSCGLALSAARSRGLIYFYATASSRRRRPLNPATLCQT